MANLKVLKTKKTRKYEGRQEEILRAAARLFNRKGIKSTSLSEIAEAVGLVTNSVTYYYRRKDDLAAACFMRSLDIYNALVDRAERQPTSEGKVSALIRSFFALLAEVAEGSQPEPVAFLEARSLVGAQREEVTQAYNALFRRVRRFLANAVDDRQMLNARTHLLLSILHSLRLLAVNYAPEDYPRVAEEVVDIVLRGISSANPPDIDGDGISRAADAFVRRANESSDSFLKTATLLINEQGYRGASVEKISSHLNLTKGAFYHHNENKSDLVADCFSRTFMIMRAVQQEAAGERSGWAKLIYSVLVLARFQLSEAGPLLRRTALAALPPVLRQDNQLNGNRITNRFTGFIMDGIRDGSIRLVDPVIAAHAINELVNALSDIHYWTREVGPANVDQVFAYPLLKRGILSK
jgi:AcrR family transcriptional regulator